MKIDQHKNCNMGRKRVQVVLLGETASMKSKIVYNDTKWDQHRRDPDSNKQNGELNTGVKRVG